MKEKNNVMREGIAYLIFGVIFHIPAAVNAQLTGILAKSVVNAAAAGSVVVGVTVKRA
jgi:hypothetical protein